MLRDDAVEVDPSGGSAVYQVADLAQKDWGTFENAILGGSKVRQGRVSFRVEWTATDDPPISVDNADHRYRALVRTADATMSWTARTPDYEFRSGPPEESALDVPAQLGQERNGSYY